MNVVKAKNYSTGSVTSRDGTVIGYRRMGSGPGLILLHGGMQAAQNLMKLAAALSDAFAVYVPDRRGRGLSRPFGDNHGVEKEVQDLEALMAGTGARDVFGLSAGALIALRATLELATLRKVALYEPPLAIDGAPSPMAWVPRYEKELAKGDLAAAMVSCMRGTGDPSIIRMPRFVLVPLMRLAIRTDAASEARSEARDDVPLDVLIRSVHFDARLAAQMEGTVENFKAVGAEILLIGGDRSTAYLRAALNALAGILPNATRIELPGLGHIAADDAGQPERVAGVLRPFFSGDVPFRA